MEKAYAERAKAEAEESDKRPSREILLSIERIVMKFAGTDPNQTHNTPGTKN
jgi:hypothetical protein